MILGGVYALAKRRDKVHAKEQADAVAKAVEETRTATEAKAEKAKESQLRVAKNQAEKEKQAAIKEAVAEALAARDETPGEKPEEGGQP